MKAWPCPPYPLQRTLYPLYQRLGGPQSSLDWCTKSHPHRDSIHRLQLTVSSYTHYPVPAHKTLKIRYTEHILHSRSNNPQVAYAVRTLNKCHECDLFMKSCGWPNPSTENSKNDCLRKFRCSSSGESVVSIQHLVCVTVCR